MAAAGTEYHHGFDPVVRSPPPLAELRARLRELLADIPADRVDDVLLVATELVANAYEHTAGLLALHLFRSADRTTVRVEVDDASPALAPYPGTSRLGDGRGRGLLIVQAVSTAWGVRRQPACKTLWADVPTVPA
jgi:anti-sigma regulatory factor (Ser/Thr protein kinase)